MSTLAQFADIPPILNAALAAGGAQYVCDSYEAAVSWRARAYKYRTLLRNLETQRYAHVPGYEVKTPYDVLMLRINDRERSNIVQIDFAAGPGKLLGKDGKPLDPVFTPTVASELEEEALRVAQDLGLEI